MILLGELDHVMIDVETLDTTPRAAVLSLGLVLFDRGKVYLERQWCFDVSNEQMDRVINPETVRWWMSQDSSILATARVAIRSVESVYRDLLEIWNDYDVDRVWAKPAHFDIPILESLFDYRHPWTHREVRCMRTVEELVQERAAHPKDAHSALADAKAQAEFLIDVNRRLFHEDK